jgi:phosphoglucomutase
MEFLDVFIKKTNPFVNQKMGTSGIRKKTKIFQQENYLENFIQSVFSVVGAKNKVIFIGGDGRFYNNLALQVIIKIAIANSVKKIFIAKDCLCSTPAFSMFIRKNFIDFGILLSASHNIAGENGDFGIKINLQNGAPCSIDLSEKINRYCEQINEFLIANIVDVDVSNIKTFNIRETEISVVDGVSFYLKEMENIFNFDKIDGLLKDKDFYFKYDGMYAITSLYAKELFTNKFFVEDKNLLRCELKNDYNGISPDPSPFNNKILWEQDDLMESKNNVFLCASDGDGDRNLIMGKKGFFINPCDSLAVLTHYHYLVPFYKNLHGVARSCATSNAVDIVAKALSLPLYIVPTGWKFFANLMDNNKISLCGEESFGTSSLHIREKDGIWAILFWLNVLAETKKNTIEIMDDFYKKYGRVFFNRIDYENIDSNLIELWMQNLKNNLNNSLENLGVKKYYNFDYHDLISDEIIKNQAFIIEFLNDFKVVLRKSGTGTSGETLRIYLSGFKKYDSNIVGIDSKLYLENLFLKLKNMMGILIDYSNIV